MRPQLSVFLKVAVVVGAWLCSGAVAFGVAMVFGAAGASDDMVVLVSFLTGVVLGAVCIPWALFWVADR